MAGVDRIVQHDTPYVNVTADLDDSILMVRWKNYAPSGTYRVTLDLAVEWIGKYGLKAFLTDQRRRGAIMHEDEMWLVQDWAPRMAKAGLRRAAVVQSADFFNRTSVERMVKAVVPTIPYIISNFQTMEAAREWLMTAGELGT
ncbi:MAG TPA: hypothetical protein PK760_12035 [Flavobacteriales bacterium]|nr:hypothetical protein [Flavobacteriales bacterium]